MQPRFEDLIPSTPSLKLLPAAICSLLLAELLDALLSGFELNLYDGEEWTRVWWVAERLAGRLQGVLEGLRRDGEGGKYVEAKWLEAKGLREMCKASLMVRWYLGCTLWRTLNGVYTPADGRPSSAHGAQPHFALPRLR